MSGIKAFGRPVNILERTRKLLKAKAIRKPSWFDAMEIYPPDQPVGWVPKPQKIEYPEDRLLAKYFKKNPTAAKKQVFNLMEQEKKPPALLFVLRQLELMKKEGLTEPAAYEKACEEMRGRPEMKPEKGGPQPSDSAAGPTEDARSLADAFDEWMKTEDSFWKQRAASVRDDNNKKPE